jgi:predicted MFS family arabinose efflux permease
MTATVVDRTEAARAASRVSLSILFGASLMLSLAMGMRQSLGLFLGPVTHDLGIGTTDFTFAIALQNITWGVTQPFVGALADRIGFRPVIILGTLLYVSGLGLMLTTGSALGMIVGPGLLVGLALSCTASALAMSAAARAVPDTRRSLVLGIVSAAGSLGTFLVAPMAQALIVGHGWHIALIAFIVLAAAMLPAGFLASGADRLPAAPAKRAGATLGGVLREASRHRGFLVMSGAYFVCGLQLVFLTTHLPTYLAICGMDPMLSAEALSVIGFFNIVGSWLFGWLGGRYPKHVLLGLIYIMRSLFLAAYFALPASPSSTLVFAAAMGTLWLGVVPLVSGLVAQMFGLRFMATMVGVAFFSHQVGSFLGAWGGGLIYDALGSYDRAWQIGVAIGLIAGVAQIVLSDPRPRSGAARPVPAAA